MNKKSFIASVIVLFSISGKTLGQYTINPSKGYSENIGNMVAMLDDLKNRVTRSVVNLSDKETDFLLDEKANRIGALIMHLAATEVYYQVYTFEDRGLNEEEKEKWQAALSLGDEARDKFKEQPIKYYLDIWDEVRKKTKKLLKAKDDKWFTQKTSGGMNNHWAWFHVMEHQANHMGQIRLIMGRF